ncbi:MAG: hypothetical protein N2422_11540 [Rhodobacteraceae bacterium]|nr:hypothetical protein [Paracoccaceae bacterium]
MIAERIQALAFDAFESFLILVLFLKAGFRGRWLAWAFLPLGLWIFWTVYNLRIQPGLSPDSFLAGRFFRKSVEALWYLPLAVVVLSRWPVLREGAPAH